MNKQLSFYLCFALCCPLAACKARQSTPLAPRAAVAPAQAQAAAKPAAEHIANGTAYLPPQCYTKTQDAPTGRAYNPCQTCHNRARLPNFVDDADLQTAYTLPSAALVNPWTNLFHDRAAERQAISNETVLTYVRKDNYGGAQGLAARLQTPEPAWDRNSNKRWDGYTPDAAFAFDEHGFDRSADGGYTGWRAFGYYPFPGTFWPTNGSAGDVLIRLPRSFQQNADGVFDVDTYRANLALVEAVIKQMDIHTEAIDERAAALDLNSDGKLGVTREVKFTWAPLQKRFMSYAGMAGRLQANGELHLAGGLFPEGTEMLHTVRYLDVAHNGHKPEVVMAPRLKELRYARKAVWRSYSELDTQAFGESNEKRKFPDRAHHVIGDSERGVSNGQGWLYQGFIENAQGHLRPQTLEETASCVGCHGGTGATVDGTFAFARKLDGTHFQDGWFHWTQHGLQNIAEPKRGDGRFEYTHYLEQTGAANEYRDNDEAQSLFFDANGNLKPTALATLHKDISTLLLPSPARALELNKAYWLVVKDQSFIKGRDARLAAAQHVHKRVEFGMTTGIEMPVASRWAGLR